MSSPIQVPLTPTPVISSSLPSGPAGGGLTGTYPNPAVAIVGSSGATTQYLGATNVPAAEIEPVAGNVVLNPTKTYHDIDTSALRTLSLPVAAAIGDIHVLSDVTGNAGANNVTVNVESGGTINGVATATLSTAWFGRNFRKIGATAWIAAQ